MTLRCRLGLHRWEPWIHTRRYRVDVGVTVRLKSRMCHRCRRVIDEDVVGERQISPVPRFGAIGVDPGRDGSGRSQAP